MHCRNVDLKTLKHEAEYFGILPLGMCITYSIHQYTTSYCYSIVKRLSVCDELDRSNCGSLLFYCQIKPPVFENLPPGFGGTVGTHDTGAPSSSLLLPHSHSGLAVKSGDCNFDDPVPILRKNFL